MSIAGNLRKAANRLPLSNNYKNSPYICDTLYAFGAVDAVCFLYELGMGSGTLVFGSRWSGPRYGFTREQQHQRKAWLLFAADIADEWGL